MNGCGRRDGRSGATGVGDPRLVVEWDEHQVEQRYEHEYRVIDEKGEFEGRRASMSHKFGLMQVKTTKQVITRVKGSAYFKPK